MVTAFPQIVVQVGVVQENVQIVAVLQEDATPLLVELVHVIKNHVLLLAVKNRTAILLHAQITLLGGLHNFSMESKVNGV